MSVDYSVKFTDITVSKQDNSRVVTGWAAVVTGDDGEQIVDLDDHVIPVNVLKRAVQDAFAEQGGEGRVDVNHDGEGRMDLVESFVMTKARRKAFGFGDSGREGWIASVRVTDPKDIAELDSGELKEFSLSGSGSGTWV